jgi:hypothetical protein
MVQRTLQALLVKEHVDYNEVNSIIKKISNLTISSNYENYSQVTVKLSPESLACQNLVNLFCANYQMIISRIISLEEVLTKNDIKPMNNLHHISFQNASFGERFSTIE